MIFVTVGTHEQAFNRLIECIDTLKSDGFITETVKIQSGYSTYTPKHCEWSEFLSYEEMQKNVDEARIVITHGGPASFIAPLQIGKIPIVVPRQKKYNEHVNDHQLEFANTVAQRMGNILVVDDIKKLGYTIEHYDDLIEDISKTSFNNNKIFNDKFSDLVNKLF